MEKKLTVLDENGLFQSHFMNVSEYTLLKY
jgi:hypothetical protein